MGGEFMERWNVCLVEWWLRFNLARMLKKTGSRVKHALARDDTVLWSDVVCFGVWWLFLKDWITGQAVHADQRG
jgi:hypothetical protein